VGGAIGVDVTWARDAEAGPMTIVLCIGALALGLFFVSQIRAVPVRYAVWLCSIPLYAGWFGYLRLRQSSNGANHGLPQHSLAMVMFALGALLACRTTTSHARVTKASAPVSPQTGAVVVASRRSTSGGSVFRFSPPTSIWCGGTSRAPDWPEFLGGPTPSGSHS
jgi:hypothetical protein